MINVEEHKPMVDQVAEWVGTEKETARKMQDCESLDPDRRLYWTVRYEILADVYFRLTGRLGV